MSCLPFDNTTHDNIEPDNILDYFDDEGKEIFHDFDLRTNIKDPKFYTADSECDFASSIDHLASEDMKSEMFIPFTSDREDIFTDDDEIFVSSDISININGSGEQDIIEKLDFNFPNSSIKNDAQKFIVNDKDFGFN